MEHLVLYTDGGRRTDFGGWAVVAEIPGEPEMALIGSGVEANATHQRMEVMAVFRALEWLTGHVSEHGALILSDSKYVVGSFNEGWLADWQQRGWRKSRGGEPQHLDLWKGIYALYVCLEHRPKFEHVPGHKGNRGNEAADAACTLAIQEAARAMQRVLQVKDRGSDEAD